MTNDKSMTHEVCGSQKRTLDRLLTCDEVAWLGDILDRCGNAYSVGYPGISRIRHAARLAAIIELCELLNLGFADRAAAGNVISEFPELYILRGAEPTTEK